MKFSISALLGAVAALAIPASSALAQETLKWAHVYETSEPFHTESVWAAEEIAKRTDGRYKIDVFPASQLGKEADINQGLTVVESDTADFQKNVLEKATFEEFGYEKADWEAIRAIK